MGKRSVKGFTLLETMVTMGVLGIAAVSFMDLMNAQSKKALISASRMEEADIFNSIKAAFAGKASCTATVYGFCSVHSAVDPFACPGVGGTWTQTNAPSGTLAVTGWPIPSIRNNNGDIIYQVGQIVNPTTKNNLTLSSVLVSSKVLVWPTATNRQLTVDVTLARSSPPFPAGSAVTRRFNLRVNTSMFRVTECYEDWQGITSVATDNAANAACVRNSGTYNKPGAQQCTYVAAPFTGANTNQNTLASTANVDSSVVKVTGGAVSGQVDVGPNISLRTAPSILVRSGGITAGQIQSSGIRANGVLSASKGINIQSTPASSMLNTGDVTVGSATFSGGSLNASTSMTINTRPVATEQWVLSNLFQALPDYSASPSVQSKQSVIAAMSASTTKAGELAFGQNTASKISCPLQLTDSKTGSPYVQLPKYIQSMGLNPSTHKLECTYGNPYDFVQGKHCSTTKQWIKSITFESGALKINCSPTLLKNNKHTDVECHSWGGTVDSGTNTCKFDTKDPGPLLWNPSFTRWDGSHGTLPAGFSCPTGWTMWGYDAKAWLDGYGHPITSGGWFQRTSVSCTGMSGMYCDEATYVYCY